MNNLFLELIKTALWKTPIEIDKITNSPIDWSKLVSLAQSQCVLSLLYDAIFELPKEIQPQNDILLTWRFASVMVEERNRFHNSQIVRLFSIFKEIDLNPILLKGQGVARYYPAPLHRQYGDIDIFINEADIDKAVEALKSHGYLPKGGKSSKDIIFNIDKIPVEIHFHSIIFYSSRNQKIWEDFHEKYLTNSDNYFELNDYPIRVPSANYNALYLFLHSFKHLLSSEEITIKQLSDVFLVLSKTANEYDKDLLILMIKRLRLSKAFYSFIDLGVTYLGFSADIIEVPTKYNKSSKKILKWILHDKNQKSQKKPQNYLSVRIVTFCKEIKHRIIFFSLSPIETISYPFWILRRLPHHIFRKK